MLILAAVLIAIVGVVVGVGLGTVTGLRRFSDKIRGKLGMADTAQTTGAFGRDDVAKKVITYAGVGIILTAVVIIAGPIVSAWLSNKPVDSDDLQDVSKTVFNTLVPMFGTWVGTVIAFYFARENYEAAAKATKDLVGQLGDDRLKTISVKDAWIPVAAIDAVVVEKGAEAATPFKAIKDKLNNKVSRVPVWNSAKAVRFIIHGSVIYEFLAGQATANADAVSKAAASNNDLPQSPEANLQTFLSYKNREGVAMQDIVSKIGWVAQTATLADAKAKMEGTPDCQDVFVTANGSDTESVLGWITNADIAKKSKA